MPTTRSPLILPIGPTSEPTEPAAPEISRVSPLLGCPTSKSPAYAVNPANPNSPRYAVNGSPLSGNFVTPSPLESRYSCHPNIPCTRSPAANFGLFDFSSVPTASPRMTSLIFTHGTYDGRSTI